MAPVPNFTFRRRLVGPGDGGDRPDPRDAEQAAGRGVSGIWPRLVALHDRIEGCWVGDLIGVAALFVGLVAALFIGGAVQ